MEERDREFPGFGLADERREAAGIDFVEFDIGIADADMELHRVALLARDIGAGPEQMTFQHLIGDACGARLLYFGEPVAGGARDFALARPRIIDGQGRAVGDNGFQARYIIVQGIAERRLEGGGVAGGADAARRRDALGHRFHAHHFH